MDLKTNEIDLADVILINTCAIRDNAEQRIHGRLKISNSIKTES